MGNEEFKGELFCNGKSLGYVEAEWSGNEITGVTLLDEGYLHYHHSDTFIAKRNDSESFTFTIDVHSNNWRKLHGKPMVRKGSRLYLTNRLSRSKSGLEIMKIFGLL